MPSSHLFRTSTFSVFHLLVSISLISLSYLFPSTVAVVANATEADRLALLSFKFLIWSDPSGALSSWNSSLHHCQWQGVSCGRRHPDRVAGLALDSLQLAGQISPSLGNLTFLQMLNLSSNLLFGNIPEELILLSRLLYLRLDANLLNGGIPSMLGNKCFNLKVFYLSNNNLRGTIPSSLDQCQNLEVLDLQNNFLTGSIPPGLGNLGKLIILSASNNNLMGTIPSTLGNLTNLEVLSLYENSLIGSIPASLGQLQSLNNLEIYDNQISGSVPRSLYNLSNLVIFRVGINSIEDFLPPEMCDAFRTLKVLSIYQNNFKGKVPSSMSNCTNLGKIDISFNNFTGSIPSSIGSLQGLNFLQVAVNHLVAKTSSDWNFIDALVNCTNLQILDVTYNKLRGVIPSSLANISSLSILRLSGNPISGSIPAEFEMLTNLTLLTLDKTLLTGKIPDEIGNLRNLNGLGLSGNMFSGEIPSTFGNLTQMVRLFLYNNKLEGHIPPSLGNMQSLLEMDISHNTLVGEIPTEIMNIRSLSISINLSHNILNGSIPEEIGKWNNVVTIDLSYNNFSGQIPSAIDGCQLVENLYLEGNMLHGPIPSSLSNLKGLQVLDLSQNSFSGTIPSFISAMKLTSLNISFNDFQGELPQEGVFRSVTAVDVRGNPKLCGGLPNNHLPKCIPSYPEQKHHSKIFKIILVCIAGGFLCLIILCFLIGLYWRTRSQKDLEAVSAVAVEFKKVSYIDLARATNSFSLNNVIGSGTFGVVYKATMCIGSAQTVAIKVLNLLQHGAIRSFLSECEALRSVRHRNLIKILSVCSSIDHQGNDFKALIYEYMPNGSLETWLYPNRSSDHPSNSLTLIQRLNVAIDVAMALDYLHNHNPGPITHCDLKPSNVLLDEDMTAHVGDFGLARFLLQSGTLPAQSITITTGIKGSIGYIPPEYGMGGKASTQGDVYSYGILLLEMFTRMSPTNESFKEGLSLHSHVEAAFPARVMDIIDRNLFLSDRGDERGIIPETSLDCLISVIRCGLLCSMESAKERVAMSEVVKMLDSARNTLLK